MVKVVSFIFVPFGDLVLTLDLAPALGALHPSKRGAWQEERAVKGAGGIAQRRHDGLRPGGSRLRWSVLGGREWPETITAALEGPGLDAGHSGW